jgi:GNAT superfamily N-acetyltransferase
VSYINLNLRVLDFKLSLFGNYRRMNTIVAAESKSEIAEAVRLFREYEAWLGLDLCFQGFEAELAVLPGKYASPDGRLYLAYFGSEPAGCIALRPLETGVSEMKRLYVRDRFRGQKIGINLVNELIAVARGIGYTKLRLDTYPAKMAPAVSLYRSLGFIEIPAYYVNPYDGVLFMELTL